MTADDGDGGTTVRSVRLTVADSAADPQPQVWPWQGFFAPVDNLPVVNVTKAARPCPLKFSVGGNRGLGIFAAGYPASAAHACGCQRHRPAGGDRDAG